ncbi:MAG: hypothetical protein RL367_2891, partial [Pseudomonadota bacterium]
IRNRADLDDQAANFDFYGVRLALAADVGSTLFRTRLIAVQLAEAKDGLRIARDLASTATLGQAHGLVAGQDVARLQTNVAASEAELSRLNAELRNSKRSLLILTGTPDAPTSGLVIDALLANPPALPAQVPAQLLARRPDILSAELAVQSAAQSVKISRLALFPQLTLQPGVGITAIASPAGTTGFWSLAAGLTMPVLDRPKLLASLRVSQARGVEAVIAYERSVQTGFGEAERALTSVAADRERVEQLGRAAASARYAFDAASKGYQRGLTDLTTLVQVEQVWRQNRAALSTARATLLTDSVSAIRALGGGWQADDPTMPPSLLPGKP